MRTFIKIAVSSILVALLVFRIDWNGVVDNLGKVSIWVILAVIGLQMVALLIGNVRWWVLLALHRLGHRITDLVPIYFIGALFNNLLPTATGGDILRAYYVYRQKHGVAVAVSPIITERLVGFVTWIGVATVAIVYVVADDPVSAMLSTFLPLIFLGLTIALFLVGHSKVYWPAHRFFERWQHMKVIEVLLRIGEASHRYINRPSVIIRLVALSVLVQLVEVFLFWVLGQGVGAELGFWNYLVIVPLIFIASSLPITIGGLGVRETAAIALFALYGMAENHAATVMVLFLAVIIVSSLPGLYFFLTMKDHKAFLKEAGDSKDLSQ